MDRKRGKKKKRKDQSREGWGEKQEKKKLGSNEERGEEIFVVIAKSVPCNSLVNIERCKERI